MEPFGVRSEFQPDGIKLIKTTTDLGSMPLEINFTEFPDLAQTLAVVAGAHNHPITFTGLHTSGKRNRSD